MKFCPICPDIALEVKHNFLGTFEECPRCNYSKQISPPKEKAVSNPVRAKTEVLGTATHRIPLHSLREIGKIIKEGDAKYGRDNALKGVGNKEFQEERLEHAIDHLLRYAQGDTEENHLAKVAWYCIYQLEWLRLEQQQQQ